MTVDYSFNKETFPLLIIYTNFNAGISLDFTQALLYTSELTKSLQSLYSAHGLQGNNRAQICKPFKEPSNQFPAWRNRFLGSSIVYKYGLSGELGKNVFTAILIYCTHNTRKISVKLIFLLLLCMETLLFWPT
jgi:hypothetical protein